MLGNTILKKLSVTVVLICGFLTACSDTSPSPTAPATRGGLDHSLHGGARSAAALTTQDLPPFSFRATLDPYKIHQLPGFLMHSMEPSDIVFQRSVFNPGAGPWHTHPGPSFVYVLDGAIKLQKYNRKQGCFETPVHVTGSSYFEIADEVHRAVVTSSTPAVLLVTRFNIPPGAQITFMADDPGC